MAIKKCKIEDNPKNLKTIDDITLQTLNTPLLPEVVGFEYECQSTFKRASHIPPS